MKQTNKAVLVLTLGEFKNIGGKNVFADEMRNRAMEIGLNPGDSEKTSWAENYDALNILFSKSNLPDDVVVAFEYRAPVGGRVDCMLFGKGKDGKNNVVLFELKGWKDAKLSYNNTLIETFTGGRLQDVEHPSVQAERYHTHFTNFVSVLNNGDTCLTSIAYCYNYSKKDNNAFYHPNFEAVLKDYPLFVKEDKEQLAAMLYELLCKGQGANNYDAFISAKLMPTDKLIDAAADIIIDNDNFYLFGDQNVAFKKFKSILDDTLSKNGKSVIVIKGGPGTGKTVLALKMLSYVAKMGKIPFFTTRSTALRDQLRDKVKNVKRVNGKDASDLIGTIFDFRPSQFNESAIDLLLVDEAHRVAEKANDQSDGNYTVNVDCEGEGSVHSPLSQTLSLIYCSKVTVFFIDDKQATESSEIGASDKILNIARNYSSSIKNDIAKFEKEQRKREQDYPIKRKQLDEEKSRLDVNADNLSQEELTKLYRDWDKNNRKLEREIKWKYGVQHVRSTTNEVHCEDYTLETQCRCLGGDKFVAWLDEVLYKAPQNITLFLKKDDFNFKIFDNPNNLYSQIKSLNDPTKNITARLCAGWCWPWVDKQVDRQTGDLKKEIQIGDFCMPWETKQAPTKEPYKSMYAPDTNSWASHPMGINQVGCVYTAQGFEFDYVGVILGPDIEYDAVRDCLRCIPKKNKKNKVSEKNGDTLIRNIYRVLMSRGKYGCYIYCCDPKVADYFKRFMID